MAEENSTGNLITSKTGVRVDPALALAWVDMFRGYLTHQPDRIVALRELCAGQDVSREVLRDFQSIALLQTDGHLKPEARAVFLSSYRETPDGPCFVNPLQPANEDEVQSLRDFVTRRTTRLQEFLQNIHPRDGDDTPSRD